MPIRRRAVTDNDVYLFEEGTHIRLPEILGAHLREEGGVDFSVWAPRARAVSVIGDFNGWTKGATPLALNMGGIWEGLAEDATQGSRYKYYVEFADGDSAEKSDPFGTFQEQWPGYASVVWDLSYEWRDQDWIGSRRSANSLSAPMSIYEVHLGSWRRTLDDEGPDVKARALTYRELATELVPYVKEMGFTHVEFMPVLEHPFYGSWGYQITGYFAPTSRYGTPQEFMQLVDAFHQSGVGVILDWVPSHFPQDEHGLGYFDGAHEYEPADPRRGIHPDWNSFIFDYHRGQVRSFLLSDALFWLDKYHIDGLRVDAVASMLYLDYSRKPGEWIPNQYGNRDNLEAIAFLRRLNEDVYRACPDVQTIAEESTAWPMVSKPTYLGGLGFGLKWDMGWMHDTLQYMSLDPLYRKFHHGELTFRMEYAFGENYVLPLSHDEVVYGKGSLLGKMPGKDSQRFANLRLLFAYMFAQPGKKLIFMGSEFAQPSEWNHDSALDWGLLESEPHRGVRLLVGDLNNLYRTDPALHLKDASPEGFQWIDRNNSEQNIVSFLRKGKSGANPTAVVCNFSGAAQRNYRMGVPLPGFWHERLNTDAKQYGGDGSGNFGGVRAVPLPLHGFNYSLTVDLPPLSAVYFSRMAEL